MHLLKLSLILSNRNSIEMEVTTLKLAIIQAISIVEATERRQGGFEGVSVN